MVSNKFNRSPCVVFFINYIQVYAECQALCVPALRGKRQWRAPVTVWIISLSGEEETAAASCIGQLSQLAAG